MKKQVLIISVCLLFACNQVPKNQNAIIREKPINQKTILDTAKSEEPNSGIIESKEYFDSTKCNIQYVIEIFEKQNNLDTGIISDLLRTMDSSCKNNVEFGEFSNEMMFIVLAKRPDLFLETYHRLIDQIDTAYLNFELRSPIHDLIPLDSIIVEIENLDFDKNTKEILLNELKKGVW